MAMFIRRLRIFFVAISNLRDGVLRDALVLVFITLIWAINLFTLNWTGRHLWLVAAAAGPILTLGGYIAGMLWPYWRRNWIVRIGAVETIAASVWLWREASVTEAIALTWQPIIVATLMVLYHEVKSIFPAAPGHRLFSGDTLPDFELSDSEGNLFTREMALAGGPVLFIFYRGDW